MRKLIQLVHTHHSSTKGRWRKMPSHWLPCTQQDHMKIYLAYAKRRRHFCPTQWCEILLSLRSMSRISPHPIGWVINTKNSLHITILTFLGLAGYYRKFIKDFAKMVKPLTLLTYHKTKFEWTPTHHTAFMMLKAAIIQAPILCYSDLSRRYIVYADALDDACGANCSQEHDGANFQ